MSAVVVETGEDKEDRLVQGSYVELRKAEERVRKAEQQQRHTESGGDSYLPDFLD